MGVEVRLVDGRVPTLESDGNGSGHSHTRFYAGMAECEGKRIRAAHGRLLYIIGYVTSLVRRALEVRERQEGDFALRRCWHRMDRT